MLAQAENNGYTNDGLRTQSENYSKKPVVPDEDSSLMKRDS
jgi:hypothetical protein